MFSVEHPPEPRADASFTAARTRAERLRRLRAREVLRGLQALAYRPLAAVVHDRWGLQRVQQRLANRAPDRVVQIGATVAALPAIVDVVEAAGLRCVPLPR